MACSCCRTSPRGTVAGKWPSRSPRPPILTLTPEQESEANSKIKRFMEDRFELELGTFEVG